VKVSTATHSDILVPADAATNEITPPHRAAAEREENPPRERDRSADLEFQLEIQTIASRILAAALIDGAREAESVAG
jgi:hypothetical protein